MAAIANKPLPPGASDELWRVAEWLQGPKAKYAVTDNIKFCSNPGKLEIKTANLLKTFLDEMPKVPLETAVAAIRFEQTALVPIDAGWVVYLIPAHEVNGVAVEDHTLYSDHYVQLTKDTNVSGSFYGLIFMFRFDPRNRRERMRSFLKRALGGA